MAVTKTHPIKSTLKAAIDYILNPEKTDGKLLASSFGCGLETADIEFAWTREAAGDRGTHLGRHLIQSFAVGETTPEEAHKIGMELAGAVLGGKYEFVLTTHVDKDHLHNHLIFNAVSFVDYKKYHSNKQSYTSNENGYNLVEDLHDCERPWTMWRKVAIWTQAIYNAFNDNICEYDDEVLRSKEKEIIDRIAVVNVKKSNGGSESEYEDLKKYALEDRLEIKRELEIIQPDIIVCGNNLSLLKLVLGEELQNDDTWDNMLALWKDTLVLDYYHPAVHYPNRVNYYALMAICDVARKKYGTPVWSEQNEKY